MLLCELQKYLNDKHSDLDKSVLECRGIRVTDVQVMRPNTSAFGQTVTYLNYYNKESQFRVLSIVLAKKVNAPQMAYILVVPILDATKQAILDRMLPDVIKAYQDMLVENTNFDDLNIIFKAKRTRLNK